MIDKVDAVLSMACGCGVQEVAGAIRASRFFPALNTKFMGASERQGVWAERCQGCGDCVLGITGGICPIARCSKRLLNGPCGGSTGGKCEISPDVDCAWQLIWDRLKALGNGRIAMKKSCRPRTGEPDGAAAPARSSERIWQNENRQRIGKSFCIGRTWQSLPSAALPGGACRRRSGKSRTAPRLCRRRQRHRQPDRHGAHVQLCGQRHLKQMGLDPHAADGDPRPQPAGMQSDIIGAYSHGINTMLCLSGDHPHFGDHPMAANVYDIDSVQLIQMVHKMRDEGKFQGGADIQNPPRCSSERRPTPLPTPLSCGSPGWPKKSRPVWTSSRPSASTTWTNSKMDGRGVRARAAQKGAHLAGCHPMKSVGMARYMKNKVPGMDVPDEMVDRMAGAQGETGQEGIDICIEHHPAPQGIEGVAGFTSWPSSGNRRCSLWYR
jgi:hypothetical protein